MEDEFGRIKGNARLKKIAEGRSVRFRHRDMVQGG